MSTQMENLVTEDWEKKENLPLGLIGAVIGILLGSVLWVLIGQIGFIAGIAGYAIVFCGMKGYALLGKELSAGKETFKNRDYYLYRPFFSGYYRGGSGIFGNYGIQGTF